MTKKDRQELHDAWKRGAEAAAGLAAEYATTHQYRLDDVILFKLNLRDGKPRPNKRKVEDPKETWICGFALALAEMHRLGKNSSQVCEVVRDAGLTIGQIKKAGCDPYDWKELERAGAGKEKKIRAHDPDPWWCLKEHNILFGRLMSVHERPDEREESGRSKFFKVLLMKDAYVRHGVGKEVKISKAKAGTVVNFLGGSTRTSEIEKAINETKKVHVLWAACRGVITKGDRKLFDLDVRITDVTDVVPILSKKYVGFLR